MRSDISLRGELRLVHYTSIDSTNRAAINHLPLTGKETGLIVVADEQVNGSGRNGRSWYGGKGNLFMTIAVPEIAALPDNRLVYLCGVAVCEALKANGLTPEPELKWPNDIFYAHKKCGGILCASRVINDTTYFLAGIGMNCDRVPPECGDEASSLPPEFERDDCMQAIVDHFFLLLQQWHDEGFGGILDLWHKLTLHTGRNLTVQQGEEQISGKFHALSNAGELMLKTGNKQYATIPHGNVMEY